MVYKHKETRKVSVMINFVKRVFVRLQLVSSICVSTGPDYYRKYFTSTIYFLSAIWVDVKLMSLSFFKFKWSTLFFFLFSSPFMDKIEDSPMSFQFSMFNSKILSCELLLKILLKKIFSYRIVKETLRWNLNTNKIKYLHHLISLSCLYL